MRRVIYSFLSNLVMMSHILNESSLSEVLNGEIRNINSFLTYKCYRTPLAKQICVFIVLFSKFRGCRPSKDVPGTCGTIKGAKQQKDGISHQSLEPSTSSARYKNNNQQINDINRSSQTKYIHSQVPKMMFPSIQNNFLIQK